MGSSVCDVCFKVFTTTYSLQEHKDAVHEHIRFLCDYCEHIASSKRNLRAHMRMKHPIEELPVVYTKIKSSKPLEKISKIKSKKTKKTKKRSLKSSVKTEPSTEQEEGAKYDERKRRRKLRKGQIKSL